MNIAYICADLGIDAGSNKGAAVHIREMIAAMTQLGHTVVLFTLRAPGSTNPIAARIFSVSVNGHKDTPLQSAFARRGARELTTQRASLELAAEVVRVNSGKERLCCQFDAIYERYSLFSEAGMHAAEKLNLPFLLEVNSPLRYEQAHYRTLVDGSLAENIEHRVFQRADRVFIVSEPLHDYVRQCRQDQQGIQVLPNGVNLDFFRRPAHSMPRYADTETTVIGFVGSLKPWHGVDSLLKAFTELIAQELDVHLLVVGGGPLQSWLKDECEQRGINDSVTLSGWQPYHALPGILATVDIAVAPYPDLQDFYFSPLKLFEYLAAGCAVVASQVGQIPSVVNHLENGFLVPPGDLNALTLALNTLASNPELRANLGASAELSMLDYSWLKNAGAVCNAAVRARQEPHLQANSKSLTHSQTLHGQPN